MGAPDAPVTLLEGLSTTRAIRRYTDDPIPDDDLASILWHAGRAPSGSNRQPFRFLVLRDGPNAASAKALLGEAFRAGWAAKREHDSYRPSRFADSMQRYVDRFERTPVVVLVCLERYRAPSPYEGSSVYPACQNLLLAARALGYGGVMTMWHQAVDRELHEMLGIPDDVPITATIPLGIPEGSHGPVRRRPVTELVYDDGWDQSAPWATEPPGTRHTGSGPPRHR